MRLLLAFTPPFTLEKRHPPRQKTRFQTGITQPLCCQSHHQHYEIFSPRPETSFASWVRGWGKVQELLPEHFQTLIHQCRDVYPRQNAARIKTAAGSLDRIALQNIKDET